MKQLDEKTEKQFEKQCVLSLKLKYDAIIMIDEL